LRRQFNLTQQGLADASGVGLVTVRRTEQESSAPNLGTIRRLAEALSVREGWLAFGEEPMLDLGHMTGNQQIQEQSGPGKEGLPGFVVDADGVWERVGGSWRVVLSRNA